MRYSLEKIRLLAVIAVFTSMLIATGCGNGNGGTPDTYSLSGTVTGDVSAGVSIAVSGAESKTTTTDTAGDYTVSGLENGTYEVTPSLAGYTFSPESHSVTISGSDKNSVNFVATETGDLFEISGAVTGDVTVGVAISLTGDATGSATTDDAGEFWFTDLPPGDYTVTPSLDGYTFDPQSQAVTIVDADVADVDFAATEVAGAFSISGLVGGHIQAGVVIELSGDASGTTTSGADGEYWFTDLVPGSYVLTPAMDGYTFTPATRSVTVTDGDVVGMHFTATAEGITFEIAGHITGDVQVGVVVELSGDATATTTTDFTGGFVFGDLSNGTYDVTPLLEGYTFSPEYRSVTLDGDDVLDVDFVATAAAVYSISGVVTGDATAGVTVVLSGEVDVDTVTDASGAYSFTDLANGFYTVTPSLDGYIFDPVSLSVTIESASVPDQDFAASEHSGPTASISGVVLLNNVGTEGVVVDLLGPVDGSASTDATGYYEFPGLPSGDYDVVPWMETWTFGPDAANITVAGTDIFDVDFDVITYSVSGMVHNQWGEGLSGVTIGIAPAVVAATQTTQFGEYELSGVPNGDYTLIPSYSAGSALFDPSVIEVTVQDSDVWGQPFSAQLAFDITGTVDYVGPHTGRVFILVAWQGGGWESEWGVSVMGDSFPKDFRIRGVGSGDFFLFAYMDHLGMLEEHAMNPQGISAPFQLRDQNEDVGTILLGDPSPITPDPPEGLSMFPADGGGFVMWNGQRDAEQRPVAERHNLYWSTDPAVSPTNTTGGGSQLGIPSNRDFNHFILTGLTNGTDYYLVVTAEVGDEVSAPSATTGPITIGDPSGGHTVSGDVTFEGFQPTGAMLTAAVTGGGKQPGEIYVGRTLITGNPQAYSIAGVPDGNYQVYVLVDMDEDGFIGIDDIDPNDERGSFQVSVSGADVVQNGTLGAVSVDANANTQHGKNSEPGYESEWYSAGIEVSRGLKIPVRVALIDGPEAMVPQDLGMGWAFSARINRTTTPEAGEIYAVEIEYRDGTQEVVTIPITTVLNSFATHLTPVGDVTGDIQPTFSWEHPASAPAWFEYQIGVWETNGPGLWWSDEMPSSQTSADYNFDDSAEQDPLTSGVTYGWSIEIWDEHGNQASNEISFTP